MSNLKNDKVTLRALEPEDAAILYDWENDPENWNLTTTYIPFNRSTLVSYSNAVQDIFAEKQYRFVIVDNSTKKAIGFIDIFDFDPIHQRAGIGILIAGKENRQSGFGKAALEVLIHYAKNVLLLHQIFANVLDDNEPSMRLFIGAGFVKCGVKKSWHRKADGFYDEIMYQLVF
jgi:diamine N-acetyltransferase